MVKKTVRLIIPDWQAGDNPTYALGAQILEVIAPQNVSQETLKINVPRGPQSLKKENGVTGPTVLATVRKAKNALEKSAPDNIITLGGNCLVSQAPINYLNDKYNDLGVIWVDAHPDISNPDVFYNEHAMVLGNLLGHGDPAFNKLVDHPLSASQVFYAGLQKPTVQEQQLLRAANLNYENHNELDLDQVKQWITENHFSHLYVHFDIDVMDPTTFYATYFNNPSLTEIPDNAAKGSASQKDTWQFLTDINDQYDLVGLTIAEYLPWSAQQLQHLMSNLKIFRD